MSKTKTKKAAGPKEVMVSEYAKSIGKSPQRIYQMRDEGKLKTRNKLGRELVILSSVK